MKAAMKKKWVKALRSGEFLQGSMALKEYDTASKQYSYCCLGVLRALYPEKVRKTRAYRPGSGSEGFAGSECLSETSCGIPFAIQDKLAQMNDGQALLNIQSNTFKQIAAWIERNL
jgi:hypothetical protein